MLLLNASPVAAEQTPSDTFMKGSVSNQEPFLGESVIYSLEFFTRLSLPGPSLTFFGQGLTDFALDESRRTQLLRGVPYNVISLRRLIFPEREGDLIIPEQRLNISALLAPESRTKRSPEANLIVAPAVKLRVKPLPPVPSEYEGAISAVLVGRTTLNVNLDRFPLSMGQTRRFEITITSAGNVAPLVFHPGASEELLAYDEPRLGGIHVDPATGLMQKRFVWTLVPLEPGRVKVSAGRFLTFDPRTKLYDELSIQPLAFLVNPAPRSAPASVETPGAEAQPIRQSLYYREPNIMERLMSQVSASSALLFVIVIILSAATVYIHLNLGRWRHREKEYVVGGVRDSTDVRQISLQFRHALVEILGVEEQNSLGLSVLLRDRISDDDLRRNIEVLLQDLASILYSGKGVSVRKLKGLKLRAALLLNELAAETTSANNVP